jgi:hypothetical protein
MFERHMWDMRIEEPLRSVPFLAVSVTACTVQGMLARWPAGVEELNQISRHPHIGDDGHGWLYIPYIYIYI